MQKKTKENLIDLSSEENGGSVLLASDEFFAPKENLLKKGRGEFIPDKYTELGKWMDGWETRRRRKKGHEWCLIRLGKRGMIKKIDIDTNHFVGNHPTHTSVDACQMPYYSSMDELISEKCDWIEILTQSGLKGDSQNLFTINDDKVFTHLRLKIFPDGGVARLKVFGQPDDKFAEWQGLFDAAALENGCKPLACSNMHFGNMENIIKPGFANDMRDGWETRRRRDAGYDWVILKLGAPCTPELIVVDTSHFKGNFPESFSLEGSFCPSADEDSIVLGDVKWEKILPETKLKGNMENIFQIELNYVSQYTHVRLNIYPDGGVSRLRVLGHLFS